MRFAKCPYCKEELVTDKSYDIDIVDINTVINILVGHCPNCDKKFQWEESYKYSHFSNLEEI